MYFKTALQKLIFITLAVALMQGCNNKGSKPSGQATDTLTSVMAVSRQIEATPKDAELYYKRATLYFQEKRLDHSLADIDQAISINNTNALYYYFRGRVLYAMNRTQEAAKMYESSIALNPDFDEARLKLASLYYVVKEHRKSIDQLNTVIAHNKSSEAYFTRGMNQKELHDTARAISSFQLALESDAANYDAAMQLGLIFTAKRDKIAESYFGSAIRLQPRNAEAYFGRAYYYQQVREFQKALFDYRRVIDIDPSSDKAYYNVGYINFEAGKYAEALKSWNICLQMNNNNIEAYYMRGLLYESQGNREDARLNYDYVLQLDPSYTLAKQGLQRLGGKAR